MTLYFKNCSIEIFIVNCVPGTTQFIKILIIFPILSIEQANPYKSGGFLEEDMNDGYKKEALLRAVSGS